MRALFRRMLSGAAGPLMGAVALFALPLLGALFLDTEDYAFWAILASISTVALSLDFGGQALLSARFYSEPRGKLVLRAAALSASGALIVGGVSVVLWLSVGTTELGTAVPLPSAIGAIIVMAVSASIRSVLAIFAQAALILESSLIRNIATAAQAFLAAALTVALLAAGCSYWALPLGWLVSSVLVLVPTLMLATRIGMWRTPDHYVSQRFSAGRFAAARTGTTLLNAVLLQGDRWIVGIIGGPAALEIYEVAWRFSTLPRFLVQNLVVRSGADATSMTSEDLPAFRRLVGRSIVIAGAVGSVSALFVAAGYLVFTELASLERNWWLLGAMLIAFTVLGVVSVYSFIGASLGKALIDLPYVLTGLVLMAIAASLAYVLNNTAVFELGYLAGILCCSFVFSLYGPRMLVTGLSTRGSGLR